MNKTSRTSNESSATDIDDVMALQAQLPSVKTVSEFGDVQTWRNQNKTADSTQSDDIGPYREQSKQRTWMPLLVRKTRDSESMFQYNGIKSLA